MDRESTLKHSDSMVVLCHPQSSCDLFIKVFFDFVQPPKLLFTCQGPLTEESLALHNTSNEERGRLAPAIGFKLTERRRTRSPRLQEPGPLAALPPGRGGGGSKSQGPPGCGSCRWRAASLRRLGRLLCKELPCVKTSLCKSSCV